MTRVVQIDHQANNTRHNITLAVTETARHYYYQSDYIILIQDSAANTMRVYKPRDGELITFAEIPGTVVTFGQIP